MLVESTYTDVYTLEDYQYVAKIFIISFILLFYCVRNSELWLGP